MLYPICYMLYVVCCMLYVICLFEGVWVQTAVIFAQEREGKAARKRSLSNPTCRYLGRLVIQGFLRQFASGDPSWRQRVCDFYVHFRQKPDLLKNLEKWNSRRKSWVRRGSLISPFSGYFGPVKCGLLVPPRRFMSKECFWSSWGSYSDAQCPGQGL